MTRVLAAPAAVLAVLLALLAPVGSLAEPAEAAPRSTAPFYRDPAASAVSAARTDPRFAMLAAQPTAVWLTDGYVVGDPDPYRNVRTVTAAHLARAAAQRRPAVLVLYAVPQRDCSGGGLRSHGAYRAWVRQVAKAVRTARGATPWIIVEPDALPMLGACAGQGDRLGSLRFAAKVLARAGARVYLDAGHSGWHTPRAMAKRLVRAGAKHARGFSTNVANFRATSAEQAYGTAVRKELRRLKVKRARFVIDTSRNGSPSAVRPGEWCNPRGARVGPAPKVIGRGGLDARLWVKPPGESDGVCAPGDVPGGQWSSVAALRLLGLAT
ncbi:glycoside hydrolase family 6 protein [Nocardioides sp. zg-ZUI104]|uniref:glycoside hydrolase family 6 protein n=1 Tax=Nocardioides faecalis TaxID=2803858 RepID=UPI001BCE352D|nr:glycoside hydrolase family 6 protein [Nocardioides faecalis]MBS4751757.1 glycoside hydrolase family 6 protein [Nocardioides faecalis]